MARRLSALLVTLVVGSLAWGAPAPKGAAKAPPKAAAGGAGSAAIQKLLDTKALAKAYNPELLGFLTEEGRGVLSPAQQKQALAQLAATFKEQLDIKPAEQATASLAALAGILTPGTVGSGISEGAFSVWKAWVDSAFVIQKAGYAAEARAFFTHCLQVFPYDTLKASCAIGLANDDPEKAMAVLTPLLDKKQPMEVTQMALRLLGDVASAERLPAEKRSAIVADLAKYGEGILNASYYEAAADGLGRSRDPGAVEPLRKLSKGMKEEATKRAALRALVLVFKDADALESTRKKAKGGFMSNADDQVFAGALLIEAGDQGGFEWAQKRLAKGKGLFKSDKDRDYCPEIVAALVARGDAPAKQALVSAVEARKKRDDWLTAWIAIGAARLGDTSHLDLVRQALAEKDWPQTRLRAAEALGVSGDYSGVAVITELIAPQGVLKSAGEVLLGKYLDPAVMRPAAADALGTIDAPECVPVLVTLLQDKRADVRVSAAYALARMKNPAALPAIAQVLSTDFGKDGAHLRTPEVQAYVLRAAAASLRKDPGFAKVLSAGKDATATSVRFLALAIGLMR